MKTTGVPAAGRAEGATRAAAPHAANASDSASNFAVLSSVKGNVRRTFIIHFRHGSMGESGPTRFTDYTPFKRMAFPDAYSLIEFCLGFAPRCLLYPDAPGHDLDRRHVQQKSPGRAGAFSSEQRQLWDAFV